MKAIKQNSLVLVIITFIIFAFGCSIDSDDNSTSEKRTSITEYEAKAVAEGQVETLLKSPSTAKFSGLRDTKIEPIENGYKVTGYVDSQNSFGAMIRSNYSVEIYLDIESDVIMYRNLILE